MSVKIHSSCQFNDNDLHHVTQTQKYYFCQLLHEKPNHEGAKQEPRKVLLPY